MFSIVEDAVLPAYSILKTDAFIVNAKRYCNDLHNFDSDASRFRYPVNKNCDPYIHNVKYYNFLDIGVLLESLCNAVDGIHGEIERRFEYFAEMEAELRSCY